MLKRVGKAYVENVLEEPKRKFESWSSGHNRWLIKLIGRTLQNRLVP